MSAGTDDELRPIRPSDESIVKVYNVSGTYTAIRISAETRASAVHRLAAKKLKLEGPVVLAEIRSNGGTSTAVILQTLSVYSRDPLTAVCPILFAEYNLYKDDEMSIESKLSVNGRLFCCAKEELAHIVCLSALRYIRVLSYTIFSSNYRTH